MIKAGLPHDTSCVSLDMSGSFRLAGGQAGSHYDKVRSNRLCDCRRCYLLQRSYSGLRETPILTVLKSVMQKSRLTATALEYEDFSLTARDCDVVASEYGVDRVEQDEWAYRSHMKYNSAWNAGKFKEEIFPFSFSRQNGEPVSLGIDEQYRPDITLEELSRLKNIRGTKGITAGNSAGMSDGASAVIADDPRESHRKWRSASCHNSC